MEDSRLSELAAALTRDSARSRANAALFADAEPLIALLIQAIEQVDCDSLTLDTWTRHIATFGAMSLRRYLTACCSTTWRNTPQTQSAWDTLVRLAESQNVAIAHQALSELGWLGHVDALPVLHRVMGRESLDTGVSLRARAFQALLRITPDQAMSAEYRRARADYVDACLLWSAAYREQGRTEEAAALESQLRSLQSA